MKRSQVRAGDLQGLQKFLFQHSLPSLVMRFLLYATPFLRRHKPHRDNRLCDIVEYWRSLRRRFRTQKLLPLPSVWLIAVKVFDIAEDYEQLHSNLSPAQFDELLIQAIV